MVETDLGTATITYEDQDGDTVEERVPNEHLAYVQDHWIIKANDREDHDVVRRIPVQRVYQVERSVEEFEAEVSTVVDEFEREIESLRDTFRRMTGDFPSGLFGGGDQRREPAETDVTRIDIGDDRPDSAGDGGGDESETGDDTDES